MYQGVWIYLLCLGIFCFHFL